MEEIEYKLNLQNPILVSHGISKIFESIANNSVKDAQLTNTKVKLLLSKCQSENFIVSTTACFCLVKLVEAGILNVSGALSSLISSIGFTRNYSALISALNSLLILDMKSRDIKSYICPFKLSSPQHPFVTILSQEKEIWRDVLNEVRLDINHHDPIVSANSEQFLRPVFLYILLNPKSTLPETCHQQIWNLLIKSKMIDLKIEILQWLSIKDLSCLIDTNRRLLELAENALFMNDNNFTSILMPIVASCAIEMLKQGRDPKPNLDIISEIGKTNCSGSYCLTIAILTTGIAESPVIYLLSLIQTCELLLQHGSCSTVVVSGLLASLLQWQAYPNFLVSNTLTNVKILIEKILSRKVGNGCDINILQHNEIFSSVIDSFPNLQLYTQICNVSCKSQEETFSWLENLFRAPRNLKENLKHFLYGLLLVETHNSKLTNLICDILLQISTSNLVASQMLSLILYKLTNSHSNFEESYNLLFTISELVTVKENIPIIVHTFETFLRSLEPLKHLAVELYYRAWKKQARLHSCLVKVLINAVQETNFDTNYGLVCTKVMKEMCEIRPESGVELVPLLSKILNRKSDNNKDALSTALALKGIVALCKSGIIDVSSTWKALAPKFENERRPIVLKSLCEFISEIPSFTSLEEDHFVNLRESLLSRLWNLAILYSEDTLVPESAFNALKSYSFHFLSMKLLPFNFRPIYFNFFTEDCETNLSINEIPGQYWIHMLENIKPILLSSAADLLITYVEDETKLLPKIRGEATSYKSLSNKSIIKAIGHSLMVCKEPFNNHQQMIITQLLRIFAHKYSYFLPNVKYDYLKKFEFSSEVIEHCIKIVSNQAEVSCSAKIILEQRLTISINPETDPPKWSIFYLNLSSICKGVSPHILQQFLQVTLRVIVQKSYILGFKEAMNSFNQILKDETQSEKTIEIIVSVLKNLFDSINQDLILNIYLSAILNIPREDLIIMTSGDWKKDNVLRLKKAILIRAEWALKQNEEECWSVVEECLQGCIYRPETYNYVLKIIQRIQFQKRSEKLNLNGVLTAMNRIQSFISNSCLEENAESEVNFLCDILIVTVCCLSGVDSLLKCSELIIESMDMRAKLFPLAFQNLVQSLNSKELIPKIMMWLHHMRSSNIVQLVYKRAFHNALISMRNEEYFVNAWGIFVSMKTDFTIHKENDENKAENEK